jgi:putative FmdB family regulatory protein
MPIYEYVCEACGKTQDVLQKMSDAPLNICPSCAAPQLKKKLSAPSFRLSGSGWYETDFKSANKRNVADTASKQDTTGSTAATPAASCGGGACPACK